MMWNLLRSSNHLLPPPLPSRLPRSGPWSTPSFQVIIIISTFTIVVVAIINIGIAINSHCCYYNIITIPSSPSSSPSSSSQHRNHHHTIIVIVTIVILQQRHNCYYTIIIIITPSLLLSPSSFYSNIINLKEFKDSDDTIIKIWHFTTTHLFPIFPFFLK